MTDTMQPRGAASLSDQDDDRLHEECGVFGVFGHPDSAAITALGLHALQHRGQEAAGIVSYDGSRFHSERRLGLVGDAFSRREVIDRLPGHVAAGTPESGTGTMMSAAAGASRASSAPMLLRTS